MRKTLLSYILFSLAVLFTASVFAQEKYEIKTHYPEGKFSMDQSSNHRIAVDDSKSVRVIGQKQAFRYALEVFAPKPDGTKQMSMTVKRIGISRKLGDMEVIADTDEKVDVYPALARPLRAIVDSVCTVTFDKDGKAIAFDGVDVITEKIIQSAPNQAAAQQAAGLRDSFNKDKMLQSFNQIEKFLPKTLVAIGDSWEFEEKNELPAADKKIELKTVVKCTLKSIEKQDGLELYRIETESTGKRGEEEIKFDTREGTANVESLQVDSKSVLLIDKKTGLLRSNESTSSTKLALAVTTTEGAKSVTKTDATTFLKMTMTPEK